MNDPTVKRGITALTIRWTARLWSIASIGLIALIVVGELVYPHAAAPATFRDFVGLFFFPFGTCVGMILAWRWEGPGGSITVASLAAFYTTLRVMDGKFPGGPWFAVIAAPGILFLLSWALNAAALRRIPR